MDNKYTSGYIQHIPLDYTVPLKPLITVTDGTEYHDYLQQLQNWQTTKTITKILHFPNNYICHLNHTCFIEINGFILIGLERKFYFIQKRDFNLQYKKDGKLSLDVVINSKDTGDSTFYFCLTYMDDNQTDFDIMLSEFIKEFEKTIVKNIKLFNFCDKCLFNPSYVLDGHCKQTFVKAID